MQIIVSGHQLDIPDSLRLFIDQKGARLHDHYDIFDKMHVILSMLHNSAEHFQAEITIHAPKHKELVATCEDADLHKAVDVAFERMERQLVRLKEIIKDKRPRAAE